jgi:hypothetical protein
MTTGGHSDRPKWSGKAITPVDGDRLVALQDQLETVTRQRDGLVQKLAAIEREDTRAARSRRLSNSVVWLILAGGVISFILSIAVAPWLGFKWTWCGMLGLALATILSSYRYPAWGNHLRRFALAIVVGVVGIPVVVFLLQEGSCRVIEAVRWAANNAPPSCSIDLSD